MTLCRLPSLVLLALWPALAAAAERPEPLVTIEGQVFDAEGRAVAGVPVRVLESRRLVALADLAMRDEFAEGPRTRSDAQGFFRIEMRPDPRYDYYYVRFYDAADFDAVRYAIPADEDVSARVRAGRPIIVQRRLADAPGWAEVAREIERAGGDGTSRGRVLRALGLPDEVVAGADGATEWRYARAGVSYRIQDGEVVERASLGPSAPGAP